MAEPQSPPAVALLFADGELGGQLREALVSFGARIVYEGAARDVSGDALIASGAHVVVVNLEPDEEAELDRLYEALEGGSYQIVFNDADASRDLSGWDRARWARHLAAKLLGTHDVDPPRPARDAVARPIRSTVGIPVVASVTSRQDVAPEPILAGVADAEALVSGDAVVSALTGEPELDPWTLESTAGAPALATADADTPPSASDSTEAMAAELEALLAENANDDDTSDTSDTVAPREVAATALTPEVDAEALPDDSVAAVTDVDATQPPVPAIEIQTRQHVDAPAPVTDWELVDMAAAPPVAAPKPSAADFGIQKMEPADYLKPEADNHPSPVEPGMHLELVSLEESLAPTMSDEPVSEMLLGEGSGGIRRVVVVCAGHESTSQVGAFLAGLPALLPALVLVIQHQHEQAVGALAAALDGMTRLPVAVATEDDRVRQGNIYLVPAGRACELDRGGRMHLPIALDTLLGDPSIDECLSILAGVFGADTTAVVLAGASRDALAGAQEVHDRGGQVWIQDPAAGAGSMVAAIQAEGLADAVGTPTELARRLSEAFA